MFCVMMNSSIFKNIVFVHLCCILLLMLEFGVCKETMCKSSERETLLKVKNHLKDSSNRLSSWNATVNSNCCEWTGVVCNNVTSHVAELHLYTSFSFRFFEKEAYRRWSFGGEINPCLVDLKRLSYLDFSGNPFLGEGMPIPSFIGTITSLTHLNLSRTGFRGKIPPQIGNLSNLVYLDLRYGDLSAENVDWLSSMSKLEYLDLGGANLSNSIHWLHTLQALPSLTELYLEGCILPHNNQPSSVNFSSLHTLDLSQTYSFVPRWIFGLKKLVSLQLSGNEFQGPIPDGIQNLTLVEYLDLSDNSFSSSIPDWLYNLHRLKFLDLWNNNLHGTISDVLGNLTSLVTLYLSYNQFSGNPFKCLRSLSKLSTLVIDGNNFEGVVYEEDLANLKSLESLYASGNNFTLEVGPNWLPSFQLTFLGISSWQLGPKFPSWIRSQNKLRDLEMSNTGISDSIPTWFWEVFSQLHYLDLSHNDIHGELPTTLKNPMSIQSIDLSTNHLYGKLPYLSKDVFELVLSNNSFSESMNDFLCKNHNKPMQLEVLNLASNNLSGKIPDCWTMWPFLEVVNLQSNHFVGNLPPSIGSLVALQSLEIRNNSLSGILPTSLKKNNQLIVLDLGENNLSGSISTWMGEKFLNMKILRLRSNSFSGRIPNEICDMSLLQVLDLAQNNLSGNIPSCFNNLSSMTLRNRSTESLIYFFALNDTDSGVSIGSVVLWLKGRGDEYKNFLGLVTSIDLSSNKLLGEIPREITDLNGLCFLNLSHNQLIGDIPQDIGNMGSLQSLDFSRNQLSGEIPPTISNLSFLGMLDLSYNHLKGKIPTGTQMQTFDASNFIGNSLCGPPLPTKCNSNGKIHNHDHTGKGSHRDQVNGFFLSIAIGFVLGLWIVIAPLLISRSWRSTYFRFLDRVWFKLQSLC